MPKFILSAVAVCALITFCYFKTVTVLFQRNKLSRLSDGVITHLEEYLKQSIPKSLQQTIDNSPIIKSSNLKLQEQSLELIKSIANASIVYALDSKGTVTASTVLENGTTLKGKNFMFRQYFQNALLGKTTLTPAVGVVTNKRGLYYSFKTTDESGDKKVIVLKYPLKSIDEILNSERYTNLLLTPERVVFSSSTPGYMYTFFGKENYSVENLSSDSRQFHGQKISNIGPKITNKYVYHNNGSRKYYIIRKLKAPFDGWSLVTMQKAGFFATLSPHEKVITVCSLILLLTITVILVWIWFSRKEKEYFRHSRSYEKSFSKKILESIPAMIIISDKDGSNITRLNHYASDFFALSEDELYEKNWLNLLNSEAVSHLMASYSPSQGELSLCEVELTNPEDKVSYFNISIIPANFTSASSEQILFVGFDISNEVKHSNELSELKTQQEQIISDKTLHLHEEIKKREKAQVELVEEKKFSENIIAALPMGLFAYHLAAPEKLMLWDKKMENLTGIKMDDIKEGKLTEETAAKLKSLTVVSEEAIHFFKTRKGEVALKIQNVPLLNTHGQPDLILGTAENITRQLEIEKQSKQMQVQLLSSHKMESIGQLAAGISHEINTPTQFVGDNLRFIKESVSETFPLMKKFYELLQNEKTAENIDPSTLKEEAEKVEIEFILDEVPQALNEALEGIDRVANIVRTMKDFAHIDSDSFVSTNINKAIEDTITITRNEWKYVSDLKTDFDKKLPLVECIRGEVNQVVVNIIVNAAHSIEERLKAENREDEKGLIEIKTSRFDQSKVLITISDTGTGIPEEIRNKVFDPFFTTKEVGKGTGQGLALAYNTIVKKHGGHLNLETEENEGTIFMIILPISQNIETDQYNQ